MLTQVIRRRDFLAQYHAVLDCIDVDAYVEQLVAKGYTRASMKHVLRDGKRFIEWTSSTKLRWSAIDEDSIARFVEQNKVRQLSHKVLVRLGTNATHLVNFMRDRGLVTTVPKPVEVSPELTEFGDWMQSVRGAKPSTVAAYTSILDKKILPLLGRGRDRLTARRLRAAVLKSAAGCGIDYTQSIINATRMFIRFLAVERRCSPELTGALPSVARWRLSTLPRHVSKEQVARIIDSCDLAKPPGRRDRAILLLLARLGLRASDVVGLTFDAVDWSAGRIRVCGKGRRENGLPLPQDVGDAVLSYLRSERPKHSSLHLFLTVRAPIRPLSAGRITTLVNDAITRSGVDAPTRGAHLLRHSAAVAMLNEGLGLEKIAAVLRHAQLETTAHYAKVDRSLLSPVAAIWPKPRAPRLTCAANSDLRTLAPSWPVCSTQEGA